VCDTATVTRALSSTAALMLLLAIGLNVDAAEFRRIQLDALFRSEGAAVGDFNRDGRLDIAAGNVTADGPVINGPEEALHQSIREFGVPW
jgi:hypothetical protein